ncbi:uncharacterized protein LOC128559351 [Mercenaria mercenaria]|uniref:uncharacterized protein LOC128559351 n=1 Tax=Mercenaria mercenaria TaxID=6596 RepID=UPI00234F87A9|nr:uncharacterized protein LOC128559351 [Mercenaria mercenaria]
MSVTTPKMPSTNPVKSAETEDKTEVESLELPTKDLNVSSELGERNEAESVIQYFLEAYKGYIVQCVDHKDLLFYKYFCREKRKHFREIAALQSKDSVTHEMIDTILSMEDIPDRFSALVALFEEEFENEKVLRILKGEKIPSNRSENKEKIQRVCMKEICENLLVTEIIPYLIKDRLISECEGEYLFNIAKRETQRDAVMELLLKLPSRHPNWYATFILCLIESGHHQLAEMVDKELYQKIMKDDRKLNDNLDEMMSLVSGPMKTCTSFPEFRRRLNLQQCSTQQSTPLENRESLKDKPSTMSQSKSSPNDERVCKWIMDNEIGTQCLEPESDHRQSNDRPSKNKKFKRKRNIERTLSLVRDSSPLHQAGSHQVHGRYQTMNIPFSNMGELQKELHEQTLVKKLLENQRFDEIEQGSTDLLELGSIDNLCVDNDWNIQIGRSESDLSNICVELTRNEPRRMNTAFSSGTEANEIISESTASALEGTSQQSRGQKNSDQNNGNIPNEDQKSNFPTLKQLFSVSCLHPVKITMTLKEHPELDKASNLINWISKRAKEFDDDILALKAHYISTVIQKAKAENIDVWINRLLTGREPDGYYECQDQLIRLALNEFPYKESRHFQSIFSQLQTLPVGDGLSSLKTLIKGLTVKLLSVDENVTCPTSDDANIPGVSGPSEIHIPDTTNQISSLVTHAWLCNCPTERGASLQSKPGVRLEHVTSNNREYQLIKEKMAKGCRIICVSSCRL